jgi:hypothetical protein
MLRWVGRGLLGVGLVLGGSVGVAMLAGLAPLGMSWLAAVGLAKLTLVASVGLMAGGAACLRLDQRHRARLGAGVSAKD